MCIAYGSAATLSVQCLSMLASNWKQNKLLLVFVALDLTVNTIFLGAAEQFNVQAFVYDRNYPGGPSAYMLERAFVIPNMIANFCLVISTCLSDILLVCRATYSGMIFSNWIHQAVEMLHHLQR